MIEPNYRSFTRYELDLLNVLLASSFPGRDELTAQLSTSTARGFDENGSFEFKIESSNHPANVKHVVVSEGECEDVDGVIIHILLYVKDSFLKELEIFKEDNSKVICLPNPSLLRVFAPQ